MCDELSQLDSCDENCKHSTSSCPVSLSLWYLLDKSDSGSKRINFRFYSFAEERSSTKNWFKKDKLGVVFLVIIQTNVTLYIWAAIKGQKLSQHNNNNNNNSNSSPWPRILEKYNSRIWLESTFVDVWIYQSCYLIDQVRRCIYCYNKNILNITARNKAK